MSTPWKPAAELLVADLRNVFGNRLQAVVAYGPFLEGSSAAPLTCLALVGSLTADDLRALAQSSRHWERSHVATPLIMPTQEFLRSLDTFPLEYGEILSAHVVVYGEDPFATAVIAPEDLRRACELQAKSHLLHLREAFIETGGRPADVAGLVTGSAPAFTALLRNVARLGGTTTGDRVQATREGARAVGLPDDLVADMINMERPSAVSSADPARLFPEYLAAAEQLARAVDTWRT